MSTTDTTIQAGKSEMRLDRDTLLAFKAFNDEVKAANEEYYKSPFAETAQNASWRAEEQRKRMKTAPPVTEQAKKDIRRYKLDQQREYRREYMRRYRQQRRSEGLDQ